MYKRLRVTPWRAWLCYDSGRVGEGWRVLPEESPIRHKAAGLFFCPEAQRKSFVTLAAKSRQEGRCAANSTGGKTVVNLRGSTGNFVFNT